MLSLPSGPSSLQTPTCCVGDDTCPCRTFRLTCGGSSEEEGTGAEEESQTGQDDVIENFHERGDVHGLLGGVKVVDLCHLVVQR
eukprot:756509-Hanusia_phi.AAC.3